MNHQKRVLVKGLGLYTFLCRDSSRSLLPEHNFHFIHKNLICQNMWLLLLSMKKIVYFHNTVAMDSFIQIINIHIFKGLSYKVSITVFVFTCIFICHVCFSLT